MISTRTATGLTAAVAAIVFAAPAALAQDAHLARNLAATCANCHGASGNALGDMKPLAGHERGEDPRAVADFKNGNQPATIMHQIAKGYTDEQIRSWPATSPPRSRSSEEARS